MLDPRDRGSQIRITPWPPVLLPLPRDHRVMRAALYDVPVERPANAPVGARVVIPPRRYTVIDPWLPPGEARTLFVRAALYNRIPLGETYLKLAQLDLMDLEQVSSFLHAHGPLGTRAMRREFAADLAEAFVEWDTSDLSYYDFGPLASAAEPASEWWQALLDSQQGEFEPDPHLSLDEMEELSTAELGHPDGIPNLEFQFGTETLDEFRAGAGLVSDAVACWRVARQEIEPNEHPWWMLANPTPSADELDRWEKRDSDGSPRTHSPKDLASLALQKAALEGLQAVLAVGLVPFAPRLEIPDSFSGNRASELDADKPWLRNLPLFSICCAELFNHVVESEPYRVCANERCRRLFVRQEGRAVKGTRRSSGVRFCSASCARAQAQRAYRRRKRSNPNEAA